MGLMVALYALSSVNIAHALCGLPLISAETITTDLPISGCYQKSPYMGLYETPVYTIEGRDVADTGTTAILATNVSFPPRGVGCGDQLTVGAVLRYIP